MQFKLINLIKQKYLSYKVNLLKEELSLNEQGNITIKELQTLSLDREAFYSFVRKNLNNVAEIVSSQSNNIDKDFFKAYVSILKSIREDSSEYSFDSKYMEILPAKISNAILNDEHFLSNLFLECEFNILRHYLASETNSLNFNLNYSKSSKMLYAIKKGQIEYLNIKFTKEAYEEAIAMDNTFALYLVKSCSPLEYANLPPEYRKIPEIIKALAFSGSLTKQYDISNIVPKEAWTKDLAIIFLSKGIDVSLYLRKQLLNECLLDENYSYYYLSVNPLYIFSPDNKFSSEAKHLQKAIQIFIDNEKDPLNLIKLLKAEPTYVQYALDYLTSHSTRSIENMYQLFYENGLFKNDNPKAIALTIIYHIKDPYFIKKSEAQNVDVLIALLNVLKEQASILNKENRRQISNFLLAFDSPFRDVFLSTDNIQEIIYSLEEQHIVNMVGENENSIKSKVIKV